MKNMLYFLLIIFCTANVALIGMEDDTDDIPSLLDREDYDQWLDKDIKKNSSTGLLDSTEEELNQWYNQQEEEIKLNQLKDLMIPLDKTVDEIKNILLSHATAFSEDQIEQIQHSFDTYEKSSRQCNNSDDYALLLQHTLLLIDESILIAYKKNFSIDASLLLTVSKIREDFLDINGSLVENVYDKNAFSTETKIPSFDDLEQSYFESSAQDYKEKHINDHEKFFIYSWKDFRRWKEYNKTSLYNEDQLINKYIENKVKLINIQKQDQFTFLLQHIERGSFKPESIENDLNFGIFSKIINNLLDIHKDVLCSFSEGEQEECVRRLSRTAQLAFFRETGYKENIDALTKESLDCLVVLGDFFLGAITANQKNEWYSYIQYPNGVKNTPQITVIDHINRYKQLKQEFFPSQHKNINLLPVEVLTLHALTRISFQGLCQDDLDEIKYCLSFKKLDNREIIQNCISVYEFALYFNNQAFNQSDLIKDSNTGKIKPCFFDWQEAFSNNINNDVNLNVLYAKKDLLFKDPLVTMMFQKYRPGYYSLSGSLAQDPADQKEALIEKFPSLINYLLLTYEKHREICKERAISPKQFWQEADELWRAPDIHVKSSKDLFSAYTIFMSVGGYYKFSIAYPSLFTENTQLPEFAKKYQEACIALQRLEGVQHVHNEALALLFINWWQKLYTPTEGQTFDEYTDIKKGLLKKAKELNNYQWRLGNECQPSYLIENYLELGKKIVEDLMKYEEGFKFLGGTQQTVQQTADNYVYYAARSLHDPTTKGLSDYFKQQIFR